MESTPSAWCRRPAYSTTPFLSSEHRCVQFRGASTYAFHVGNGYPVRVLRTVLATGRSGTRLALVGGAIRRVTVGVELGERRIQTASATDLHILKYPPCLGPSLTAIILDRKSV